jgi:putative heme-binding domain-containing protein
VPLFVAALGDRQTEQVALQSLHDLGGPEQAGAIAELAKRNPSLEVLTAAVRVLTAWRERPGITSLEQQALDRAVAEIHGSSGSLVRWNVSDTTGPSGDADALGKAPSESRTQISVGTEGRIVITAKGAKNGTWFQGRTDIAVSDQTGVEFLASSSGSLQMWLNGKPIYHRKQPQDFRVDSDHISAVLSKGINRLVVSMEVGAAESSVVFHVRFRRKSAVAEHERLAEAVLARPGNPERGRAVFFSAERSLCLKCHRVSDQGEPVGPDLTALGSRFSRIYIAESILEPSRTIAPSFVTSVVTLQSGQVLSGIKVVESDTMLTLVDNQGQRQIVAKDAVEEQETSPLSTMPEGLEKRITEEEFVDLIAFLASLKESRRP